MIVKPNTGVTVCGTGAGDRGLTRFRRRHDRRVVTAERPTPTGWTSGGEVGQLLLESCAPVAEGGRPIGRFEGVCQDSTGEAARPASESTSSTAATTWGGPTYSAMSRSDRCSAPRCRARSPDRPEGSARCADHFAVEVLAELPGCGAQVALHPLALGRAHLADQRY